jgi:ribosomal protein S18 acetylase RimI-like enzyme
MSAPAIRPVRAGDGAAVAALLDALSAHEGDPVGPLTAEAVERDACGPARLAQGFLAEADGPPVGLALWLRAWESATAERGGFLTDLYVAEGWRGRGLGRALMAAVAAAVAAEGGTFLQLTAKAGNARARGFYRALCGPEAAGLVVFSAEGAAFARLAAGGLTGPEGSR